MNIEAEQAVIGAVLIENARFDEVADVIEASDFYRPANSIIWRAISELARAKRALDPVALWASVKPILVGEVGPEYIAESIQAVPAPSLAVEYALMVREKAVQRALAAECLAIARRAYDAPAPWAPEFTDELLLEAEFAVAEVSARAIRKRDETKAEVLAKILYQIEHGIDSSVRTGIAPLDQTFGGFDARHLSIIGARTSRGKTALATNFALNASASGVRTAYFTLEMSAQEMLMRAIGRRAEINTFHARRAHGFRAGERDLFVAASKEIEAEPIEFLYRPGMRPRDLRLDCLRLQRELGPLGLVVVDYFNLMRGDRHERDRWREMQEAIIALKNLAGELRVPILLLSQLNREVKENERPTLAHLRDTGAIEEHASNVLLIYQKANPEQCDGWETVEVIIAKQRNGPAGARIELEFAKRWGAWRAKQIIAEPDARTPPGDRDDAPEIAPRQLSIIPDETPHPVPRCILCDRSMKPPCVEGGVCDECLQR